ncbi:MAG TPA: hypothetical protein VG736_10765, partial [Vicinamibacterales bacterium]|nr:hypothetical protein [Vicinamibacterales bacterium]
MTRSLIPSSPRPLVPWSLLVCALVASLVSLAAQAQLQETMTSPSGIELVLIHPGRMTVGVFHPPYPTPPAPGTASARGATPLSPDDYARIERMARADWSDGFVVDIPRPYYIGKYEITQGQWTQVMGRNPSLFQG